MASKLRNAAAAKAGIWGPRLSARHSGVHLPAGWTNSHHADFAWKPTHDLQSTQGMDTTEAGSITTGLGTGERELPTSQAKYPVDSTGGGVDSTAAGVAGHKPIQPLAPVIPWTLPRIQ